MGSASTISLSTRIGRSPRAARGYTLHELLVTLTLVGVTAAAGLETWQMLQSVRQSTEVNEFLALLALARSEAVTRRSHIVLCPSATGEDCETPSGGHTAWHAGVLLFADRDGDRRLDEDEPILRRRSPAAAGLTVKSSRSRARLVYQPDGTTGGTNMTFTFCDRRGTAFVRYLVVSNTGRARVASKPPDGRADEDSERCP
jgi:type IV fimbrial biogenesis protein FimT